MKSLLLTLSAVVIASILFKDSKWGDAVFKAICALLLIIILGILFLLILG